MNQNLTLSDFYVAFPLRLMSSHWYNVCMLLTMHTVVSEGYPSM